MAEQVPVAAQRRVWVAVVGVTFEGRQGVLAALYDAQCSRLRLDARLLRERDNAYDRHATQVHAASGPLEPYRVIGYLPAAVAATVAPRIDAGQAVRAVALLVLQGGNPDKPGFGARVEIEIGEGT